MQIKIYINYTKILPIIYLSANLFNKIMYLPKNLNCKYYLTEINYSFSFFQSCLISNNIFQIFSQIK